MTVVGSPTNGWMAVVVRHKINPSQRVLFCWLVFSAPNQKKMCRRLRAPDCLA